MISLCVTVSGEDVAEGLVDDLEECALFLAGLGLKLPASDHQDLSDYLANTAQHEREAVFAMGSLMVEACKP